MRQEICLAVVALLICSAPAVHGEECRISIFINPLKPFLGLLNIGVECQFDPQYSLHLSAEYALFRPGYLNRIRHPDFVWSIGLRHYFSPDEPDASGLFSGALFGQTGRWREGKKGWEFFIGAELGYRFLMDNNGYISPRGLVSFPLESGKLLPGAEALFGKIL